MFINADPEKAVLKSRINDGSFITPVSSNPEKAGRYFGANKPAGVWRIEHIVDDLTIEHQLDNSQVESCRYSDSKKLNMVSMEIHTEEQEVAPGGKISMEHEWILSNLR